MQNQLQKMALSFLNVRLGFDVPIITCRCTYCLLELLQQTLSAEHTEGALDLHQHGAWNKMLLHFPVTQSQTFFFLSFQNVNIQELTLK